MTIYMDDDTIKKVEKSANKEKTSISKWVRRRITEYLNRDWPSSFISSLGSLREDELAEPGEIDFTHDHDRDPL
jgi:hypothetical protein